MNINKKRIRANIVGRGTALVLLGAPSAFAWNGAGHTSATNDAYKIVVKERSGSGLKALMEDAFKYTGDEWGVFEDLSRFRNSSGLKVKKAIDLLTALACTADTDDCRKHCGERLESNEDLTFDLSHHELKHSNRVFESRMTEYRLIYNAEQILELAILARQDAESATSDAKRRAFSAEALSYLGLGLHLVQDNFAHLLNGESLEGDIGHDIPKSICVDLDGDGVVKSTDWAGKYAVDDLDWDNHSDEGNAEVSEDLVGVDLYVAAFYHKQTKTESRRYTSSVWASVAYLRAFLSGNNAEFSDPLDAHVVGDTRSGTTENRRLLPLTNLVIDNTKTGVTPGEVSLNGAACKTTDNGSGYYGESFVRCAPGTGTNTVEFQPTFPADRAAPSSGRYKYQVYVRWPEVDGGGTAEARVYYTPKTKSLASSSVDVNQSKGSGGWYRLGTWDFVDGKSSTTGQKVVISVKSGAKNAFADAVLFRRVL